MDILGYLSDITASVQVSKVFVPGLLSPTFNLTNHLPHLNTPLENVSTPSNAGSRHILRLDEVSPCKCIIQIDGVIHVFRIYSLSPHVGRSLHLLPFPLFSLTSLHLSFLFPSFRLWCLHQWQSWGVQTLNTTKLRFWKITLFNRPCPTSMLSGTPSATGSLW